MFLFILFFFYQEHLNNFHRANLFRASKTVVTNGFCMPTSCSEAKVIQFLNQQFLFNNDLVALGGQCRDFNSIELKSLDYFAM